MSEEIAPTPYHRHFDYQDPDSMPRLVSTAGFMSPSQSGYADQCAFDAKIEKLLPPSKNGFDSPADAVRAAIAGSAIVLRDL